MNSRHRRTLGRIFADPTPADLRWRDIEALLRAARAEVSEGAGSRVHVVLADVRAVFHRPHPSPETRRGLVRAVRDFLAAAGVRPEEER
ncbi:MAG: type II toxin-antitoxin system HicA family toxin [Alphaproteobacteria bacterium]|nr:type II toxin-antitoxin system HicA family toxin [Alphaproteobacteria bacterium]